MSRSVARREICHVIPWRVGVNGVTFSERHCLVCASGLRSQNQASWENPSLAVSNANAALHVRQGHL